MTTLTETVVPTWIAAALGVATLAMLIGVLLLMARSKRAQHNQTARDEKVLRRLFIAALFATLAVIAAVMAISFMGLSAFARDDIGWHSWISLIVPLSLDGISITFGFWAFVAVKRGRHPGRSEKIVYVGALISAWINFNHGRQEWTGAAGVYLGFLSLASAWMFHELLNQFTDAQAVPIKAHRNGVPMFGERWLWAPLSTLLARRAWVVYPPQEHVEPSAANALAHLGMIRALPKRQRYQAMFAHGQNTIHAMAAANLVPATDSVRSTNLVPTTKPVPATAVPTTAVPATQLSTIDIPPATPAPIPATAPTRVPAEASIPSPATMAARITGSSTARPRPPAPTPGPAQRTTPTPARTPRTPATKLPASATDVHVTAPEPVQPPLPLVSPELLASATEVARKYRAETGERIGQGQLAVTLRIPTKKASELLEMIDDTPIPDTSVNGTPAKAMR